MMGRSGVDIDTSDLKLDKLVSEANIERANLALSERVASTTDKFVPMDHGDLRGHVDIDTDSITYTEDYADYVYNMNPFSNWSTNGTTSHWIEPSKNVNMSDWEQVVSETLLGGL